MVFATAFVTVFVVSLLLIQSAHMGGREFLPSIIEQYPEYVGNEFEDELNYVSLSEPEELDNYDWSPPNGELPDDEKKIANDDDYDNDDPFSKHIFGNSKRRFEDDNLLSKKFLQNNKRRLEDVDLKNDGIVESKNERIRGLELPRKKKNQVLCRVQKAVHHHSEAGHEFFPKSYTSYSCHPVISAPMDATLAINHDVCLVRSPNCATLHMKRFFLKRNRTSSCWSDIVLTEVGSGCDCIYHYKYRIHL